MELALVLALLVAAFGAGRLLRALCWAAGGWWLVVQAQAVEAPWAAGLAVLLALVAWADWRNCRRQAALGLPPIPGTIADCAARHQAQRQARR